MGLCPYCKGKVTLKENHSWSADREAKEVLREKKGFFTKEVMYVCPHCGHILGIGSYFAG